MNKKCIYIEEVDNPRYEMAKALVELGYRYKIPSEEISKAFPCEDFQREVCRLQAQYALLLEREKSNASLDQEDPKPVIPRLFRRPGLNGST